MLHDETILYENELHIELQNSLIEIYLSSQEINYVNNSLVELADISFFHP